MIGLVRNEWKKVFLPVLLTTVLLAIAMGVLSCTIYQNYVLHYDLEAWEVGTELFSLLYPLFVVVPLCGWMAESAGYGGAGLPPVPLCHL